jgi:hypothetical protein
MPLMPRSERPMEILRLSDPLPVRKWHAKLRKLFECWRSIHPAEGVLPGRQHFDPLYVADVLPFVFMIDLVGHPVRLRYRLLGTRMVDAIGRDLTGQWLDEAHPRAVAHPMYQTLLQRSLQKQFTWRRGAPFVHVDPDIYEIEQIMLPMAKKGSHVDLILAATIFFSRRGEEIYR